MNWITIFSEQQLTRLNDWALLLLRLTFGGLMVINHGWGKLQNLFGDDPIQFADPLGVGMTASLGLTVFAEFVCGILIVLGLFTRLATIPLIVTMLVAAFIIHWSDPFANKEMALIYLAAYTALFLMGAGKFSVDHTMNKTS